MIRFEILFFQILHFCLILNHSHFTELQFPGIRAESNSVGYIFQGLCNVVDFKVGFSS